MHLSRFFRPVLLALCVCTNVSMYAQEPSKPVVKSL